MTKQQDHVKCGGQELDTRHFFLHACPMHESLLAGCRAVCGEAISGVDEEIRNRDGPESGKCLDVDDLAVTWRVEVPEKRLPAVAGRQIEFSGRFVELPRGGFRVHPGAARQGLSLIHI